jgi:hypothetical protein
LSERCRSKYELGDDLLSRLVGKGPVTLEPAQSPVSSPLRGWYDEEPVYLRSDPEVISGDRKTIRRWNYKEYVVTITSDFSRAPREIDRTIEIREVFQAADGCSVSGT